MNRRKYPSIIKEEMRLNNVIQKQILNHPKWGKSVYYFSVRLNLKKSKSGSNYYFTSEDYDKIISIIHELKDKNVSLNYFKKLHEETKIFHKNLKKMYKRRGFSVDEIELLIK